VGKGYEDRTLPTVPWEKGIKTGRKQKIKSWTETENTW
jgi:hypothetical protein